MRKLLLTGLLLLLPVATLAAGDPATEELSAEKSQAIRTLMELTGAENMAAPLKAFLSRNLLGMLVEGDKQPPDEVYAIINVEANLLLDEKLPTLLDELVPIYHRHFSHSEIKELIAFYRSDIGQKALREFPGVAAESNQLGSQWGEVLSQELVKRVDSRLVELGLNPPGS